MRNPFKRRSNASVVADVLDAIDPRRTADERIESAQRATERDRALAFAIVVSLAGVMLDALPDTDSAMKQLRERMTAWPI